MHQLNVIYVVDKSILNKIVPLILKNLLIIVQFHLIKKVKTEKRKIKQRKKERCNRYLQEFLESYVIFYLIPPLYKYLITKDSSTDVHYHATIYLDT